jgi:hypothetical protein
VFILNALSTKRHLDDDALVDVWTARHSSDAAEAHSADSHLAECGQCRARFDAFTGWMTGLRHDAVAEADEQFSAERLAAQQHQIFRRLEALERPARVIAFPRFAQPTAVVRRGPQRWIAAGLAAGLVIGLGAGELLDLKRTVRGGDLSAHRTMQPVISQTARGGLQPISLSSDDSFLYDSDAAAPRVEALQALDALTPRVRDLDSTR